MINMYFGNILFFKFQKKCTVKTFGLKILKILFYQINKYH